MRVGLVAPVRGVGGAAGLPLQLGDPLIVLVAPGIPGGLVDTVAAGAECVGHDFGEGGNCRTVVAHRVSALRHFRGAGALEQNGVRKALDLADGDLRFFGDLLYGSTGTNARLNFAGTELAFHFDLNLAESSHVSAGSCTKFVIGGKPEFLAGFSICAHHMRSIGFKSDHSKLSHIDLLIAPARDFAPRSTVIHS